MMLSPESYYELYLKDETADEILKVIDKRIKMVYNQVIVRWANEKI